MLQTPRNCRSNSGDRGKDYFFEGIFFVSGIAALQVKRGFLETVSSGVRSTWIRDPGTHVSTDRVKPRWMLFINCAFEPSVMGRIPRVVVLRVVGFTTMPGASVVSWTFSSLQNGEPRSDAR